ncbi:hypothetical protein GCM10023077_05240 [Mycolicibacterium helvum]
MNTPTYANGRTEAAASQASTPPATVNATITKKTGLGRTDWCSGRMFTSRNYRTPRVTWGHETRSQPVVCR